MMRCDSLSDYVALQSTANGFTVEHRKIRTYTSRIDLWLSIKRNRWGGSLNSFKVLSSIRKQFCENTAGIHYPVDSVCGVYFHDIFPWVQDLSHRSTRLVPCRRVRKRIHIPVCPILSRNLVLAPHGTTSVRQRHRCLSPDSATEKHNISIQYYPQRRRLVWE